MGTVAEAGAPSASKERRADTTACAADGNGSRASRILDCSVAICGRFITLTLPLIVIRANSDISPESVPISFNVSFNRPANALVAPPRPAPSRAKRNGRSICRHSRQSGQNTGLPKNPVISQHSRRPASTRTSRISPHAGGKETPRHRGWPGRVSFA